MATDDVPVELAEIGRSYRFRWLGEIVEGVLVDIHKTPSDRAKLWCMFEIPGRTGRYGCAMSNVLAEVSGGGGGKDR